LDIIQNFGTKLGIKSYVTFNHQNGKQLFIKEFPSKKYASPVIERFLNEVAGIDKAIQLSKKDDLIIITRPFVQGISLRELMDDRRLSVEEVLKLFRSSLEGLKKLHDQKIIHRNLHPSNIIVNLETFEASLVDGCLNRFEVLTLDEASLQSDTLHYLSPELMGTIKRLPQMSSDLYSLGLIFYQALVGKLPYENLGTGFIAEQMTRKVSDPRSKGAKIPHVFAEILLRLLKKDPQDRYQTVDSVLWDLNRLSKEMKEGKLNPSFGIGQTDIRSSLIPPSLTNMEEALGIADSFLKKAKAKSHGGLFLEGESGAGKSRLLEEIIVRARFLEMNVLMSSNALSDVQKPFSLLSGVVTWILQKAKNDPAFYEGLRLQLEPHKESLLITMPEMEFILGGKTFESVGPETLGELRSLEAIHKLFYALGTLESSVLLVLDDCQWSDQLSLKFLEHFFRGEASLRNISIICAYRSEEVGKDHLLTLMSENLDHIKVPVLNRDESFELLLSMSGVLPQLALDHSFRVARGNPFLLSAELHALVEGEVLLPSKTGWVIETSKLKEEGAFLQEEHFFRKRIGFLPENIRDVLGLAAVIGKKFRLKELAFMCEMGDEEVLPLIEEAMRRHFVIEDQEGDFVFYHDRIREAFLNSLEADERQAYHLKYATSIDPHQDQAIYDLSYHLDAAGKYEEALPYALKAARFSRARYALESAEQQYRITLRAEPRDEELLREIHSSLGEIYLLKGNYEFSQDHFERAYKLAHDKIERASILRGRAELLFKQGKVSEAGELIERTLAELGEKIPKHEFFIGLGILKEVITQLLHRSLPNLFLDRGNKSPLMVKLYSRLAYIYFFRSNLRVTWALLKEINIAEAHDSSSPEAGQAYANYGILFSVFPWINAALWSLKKSLTIRTNLKDLWGQGQSYHFLGSIQYVGGAFDEAIETSKLARYYLDRTGDRWEYNDAYIVEALSLLRLGRLDEALVMAQKIYQIASSIGDAHSSGFALEVWAKASGGRVPMELIEKEISRLKGDLMTLTVVKEAKAVRLMAEGKYKEAIGILEDALTHLQKNKLLTEYVVPVPLCLSRALRLQIESLSPYDNEEKTQLEKRLKQVVKLSLKWAKKFHNNLPEAYREAGLLALLRNDKQKARELFSQSLKLAEKQSARFEKAKTQLEMKRFVEDPTLRKMGVAELNRDLVELGAGFELQGGQVSPSVALLERFSSLLEMGKKLVLSSTPESIWDSLHESTVQLLKVDSYQVISTPETLMRLGDNLPFLDSLRPQLISTERLPELSNILGMAPLKSALHIPIPVKGMVENVIVVGHTEVQDLFGLEELKLAEFVASLAGMAFENAEAFRNVQEAIKIRDEFIEIASHELRTPLTSIVLQVQMLKRLTESTTMVLGDAQVLAKSCEFQVLQFSKLVERLLSVSRLSQGFKDFRPERTGLSQVVESVIEKMRPELNQMGCDVTFEKNDSLLGNWDPVLLEELTMNLLSNSMKYGARRPIFVKVFRQDGKALLSVKDFGIGINEESKKHIFKRYGRGVSLKHYGGLGLGLYVVQKIAEVHGGSIEVESEEGKGATFTVTLPLENPEI
jgi:signal transduction histidine kinase/serine/threonine protein kinase/uncharacterized protein HemY